VSLNGRIAKLEELEAAEAAADEPPAWLDEALARLEAVWPPLEALLPPGEIHDWVCALLWHNWQKCEWAAAKKWGGFEYAENYPAALFALLRATPEDLRPAVVKALCVPFQPYEYVPDRHPLDNWTTDLAFGRTVFPEGLAPEVMRQLLGFYLEQPLNGWLTSRTCEACGLARPHPEKSPPREQWGQLGPGWVIRENVGPYRMTIADYLPACPHCGSDQWYWTSQNDGRTPPWAVQDRLAPEPEQSP
jgi:hypothetical protein